MKTVHMTDETFKLFEGIQLHLSLQWDKVVDKRTTLENLVYLYAVANANNALSVQHLTELIKFIIDKGIDINEFKGYTELAAHVDNMIKLAYPSVNKKS